MSQTDPKPLTVSLGDRIRAAGSLEAAGKLFERPRAPREPRPAPVYALNPNGPDESAYPRSKDWTDEKGVFHEGTWTSSEKVFQAAVLHCKKSGNETFTADDVIAYMNSENVIRKPYITRYWVRRLVDTGHLLRVS